MFSIGTQIATAFCGNFRRNRPLLSGIIKRKLLTFTVEFFKTGDFSADQNV